MPLIIINTNPNTYPNPQNIITLSADSNNTSKARNKYIDQREAGSIATKNPVDSPDVNKNSGDLLPACAVV